MTLAKRRNQPARSPASSSGQLVPFGAGLLAAGMLIMGLAFTMAPTLTAGVTFSGVGDNAAALALFARMMHSKVIGMPFVR